MRSERITEKGRIVTEQVFDSMDDLLSHCSNYPSDAKRRNGWISEERFSEPGWAGTRNVAEAVALARTGWPEGVAKVKRAAAGLLPLSSPQSITPAPRIADEGDEVAVDRFLDGESDCWLEFPMQRREARGRVIPILVNLSLSAGVDVQVVHSRGALVVALADALENAGYRVELIGCAAWTMSGHLIEWQCIMKRAEDALDLDRMAFAFVHPAMTRQLDFRIKELTGEGGEWNSSAQGTPREMRKEQLPEDSIYFGCLHLEGYGKALQTARDTIAKYTEEAA